MPDTPKVLGQENPGTDVSTTLYTVPALTSCVTSKLSVCEQGGGTPTFKVAVVPSGQVLAAKHYIVFDRALTPNQNLSVGGGLTLAAGDKVFVEASDANVSFSLFGAEETGQTSDSGV